MRDQQLHERRYLPGDLERLQVTLRNLHLAVCFNLYFCSCECLAGFEGPRCQLTKVNFDGSGWAYMEPLQQCEDGKLSLQFATASGNGLLLYSGPMRDTEASDMRDYLALTLESGYPVLRANIGDDELTLSISGNNKRGQKTLSAMNDGNWHTVEIFKQGKVSVQSVSFSHSILINIFPALDAVPGR